MSGPFTIVVRRRGKTDKHAFPTLAEAVDALETELRAAATVVAQGRHVERALGRDYAPAQQVAVRGELRGPGRLHAGVDVRGDGEAQAFIGRIKRRPVEPREREDAWAALRRVLELG
ncbi:MAG TPA: hypothetical protein VNT03_02915 [Baekduia sp.]|nr:hypothetical protein [Baekduia sp.]